VPPGSAQDSEESGGLQVSPGGVADVAEVVPGVEAGFMAVIPFEADGVVADRSDLDRDGAS
jgi:hypothetical protein